MSKELQFLNQNFREDYKNYISILNNEVYFLNSYYFIIKKIKKFPFDLFGGGSTFWFLTYKSLLENSIMIIWRITYDTHNDVITLKKLRNLIIKNIGSDEKRNEIKDRLSEINFDQKIRNIESDIKNIRHNNLAHLNKEIDPKGNLFNKIPDVGIDNIKKLIDLINELFRFLNFKGGNITIAASYSKVKENKSNNITTSDIEKMLTHIAKKSYLLNLPETHYPSWIEKKKRLTESEINLINEYRNKLGMSKAP